LSVQCQVIAVEELTVGEPIVGAAGVVYTSEEVA